MKANTNRYLLAAILALFAYPGVASAGELFSAFTELESPAGPGAREPHLFAGADQRMYLSWLEPTADSSYALRFAVSKEGGWSRAGTITTSDELFVNWADFPSLIALGDGTLAAHWLAKNAGKFYAYDVNVSLSRDAGENWSKPIVPHRDGTQTQHGFVSLLPWADNRLLVLWLDGRNYADTASFASASESPRDQMALHAAILDQDGELSNEEVLDTRTCTCCQTSAARTTNGVVVAYRDRSPEELRDTSLVRLHDGRWTTPINVHEDGWQISGCPVNGPAVAAAGERVAVAWFTAANDVARVNVALSRDEGESFSAPVRVDGGRPLGRVDVVILPDGSALVSWLEGAGRGEALQIRRVRADGARDRALTLALSTTGRTSGFPRMVRNGDEIYFAWTQTPSSSAKKDGPNSPTIRTAVLRLSGT